MSSFASAATATTTDPIAEAKARGGDLAQFFLGDPQSWKGPTVSYAGGAAALKAGAEAAGIDLYVHAPYPLNVASTNNRIRIPSPQADQQQVLNTAAEVGAQGRDRARRPRAARTTTRTTGFDNWRKCVDGTRHAGAAADREHRRRRQRDGPPDGADRACCGTRIGRGRAAATPVGFCLDTCHAHAGGEDAGRPWSSRSRRSPAGSTWCTPTTRRDEFDSGADRHANFGNGSIDPDELVAVVRAAGAPVVCETPGGTDGQAADIAWLRERL